MEEIVRSYYIMLLIGKKEQRYVSDIGPTVKRFHFPHERIGEI